MFDVNAVEKEAKAELAKEQAGKAKDAIKSHLKTIASAKAIVASLEREYEVLLAEVTAE
jgi:hypothetical protein